MEYEYTDEKYAIKNNIHKQKKNLCINCGKNGHETKLCNEPITSYGIVNISIIEDVYETSMLKKEFSSSHDNLCKITSKKYPNIQCYISNNFKLYDDNFVYQLNSESIPFKTMEDIMKFSYYRNKITFMMVSRKYSLGFVEFIRGKYDVSDVSSIIRLFEQMYDEEIKLIKENNYDTLLYTFLNRNNETKEVVLNRIYEGRYSNEYCNARIKYKILADSDTNCDVPQKLQFYTQYIKPKWNSPEWGFPKGRRDKTSEENLTCACREFEEETGYSKNEYSILNKIEPIEEKLIGTNGVNYKHIYYMAINNKNMENKINTVFDTYEIGEVKWFTFEEALEKIRPYHYNKKNILTRIYIFLINYLIKNMCQY